MDNKKYSLSELENIIALLIKNGYIVHGTNEDFEQFDYNNIKGGDRAKEGYGFYFSDMPYKPTEYGTHLKAIKKDDFNFLDFNDKIDLSLLFDMDKINRLKEIKERLKRPKNLREELALEDEYYKLKDYLTFNFNNDLYEQVIDTINNGANSYGQLLYLIRNPKHYLPMLYELLIKIGYDGLYNDHVYTIFNFSKLNKLVINDAENFGDKLMNEAITKALRNTINEKLKH